MPQSTSLEPVMTGRNPNGHYQPVRCSATWDWIVKERTPNTLSRAGKVRLDWCQWHADHGKNVSLTCRHFGISRPTFYRWYRRLSERGLRGLEGRSHRPHQPRGRNWTDEQARVVLAVREANPEWGKTKIQFVLGRDGVEMSVSTVGRILGALKARGALRDPPRAVRRSSRACPRPWAIRSAKRSEQPLWPGDLVQVDTKDVRFIDGSALKHLSLVDVVSRYAAGEVGTSATAKMMAGHLDRMLQRLPFRVAAGCDTPAWPTSIINFGPPLDGSSFPIVGVDGDARYGASPISA